MLRKPHKEQRNLLLHVSLVFTSVLHCPIRCHLQNTGPKIQLFKISRWGQQRIKRSAGFLVFPNMGPTRVAHSEDTSSAAKHWKILITSHLKVPFQMVYMERLKLLLKTDMGI